jgi:hypothetical protein
MDDAAILQEAKRKAEKADWNRKDRRAKKAANIQQKELLAELLKRDEEHVAAAKLNAEETRASAAASAKAELEMQAMQTKYNAAAKDIVSNTRSGITVLHSPSLYGCRRR